MSGDLPPRTGAAAGHATAGRAAEPGRRRGPVVAIGEPVLLQGFALAGVSVLAATSPDQVRARWRRLRDDVALVLLTPAAAAALAQLPGAASGPLVATLPGHAG